MAWALPVNASNAETAAVFISYVLDFAVLHGCGVYVSQACSPPQCYQDPQCRAIELARNLRCLDDGKVADAERSHGPTYSPSKSGVHARRGQVARAAHLLDLANCWVEGDGGSAPVRCHLPQRVKFKPPAIYRGDVGAPAAAPSEAMAEHCALVLDVAVMGQPS